MLHLDSFDSFNLPNHHQLRPQHRIYVTCRHLFPKQHRLISIIYCCILLDLIYCILYLFFKSHFMHPLAMQVLHQSITQCYLCSLFQLRMKSRWIIDCLNCFWSCCRFGALGHASFDFLCCFS